MNNKMPYFVGCGETPGSLTVSAARNDDLPFVPLKNARNLYPKRVSTRNRANFIGFFKRDPQQLDGYCSRINWQFVLVAAQIFLRQRSCSTSDQLLPSVVYLHHAHRLLSNLVVVHRRHPNFHSISPARGT